MTWITKKTKTNQDDRNDWDYPNDWLYPLNHKLNINFPIFFHPSTPISSNKLIRKFTSNASHKFLQKRLFPNFTNELMLRLNYKSSISLSSKWEYDEILSKLIAHFKCKTIVCLIVYSNNIIYHKYASLTLQD